MARPQAVKLVCAALLSAWLTLSFSPHAAAARLPAAIKTAMKHAGLPPSSVGIWVQDAARKTPTLAHEAERAMSPASTMKLLTTYAGLELLGPAYTWKTEVYANKPPAAGVLDGDLFIKGYGDPKLNLENFWLLLRELRGRGVKTIRGDLVLDKSYFDVAHQGPGTFDNEPLRAYNVEPDALLVNFNVVRMRLTPQAGKLDLAVDPMPAGLDIVNAVQVDGSPCGDWRSAITTATAETLNGVTLELGGRYSAACGEKMLNLSLLKNGHYIFGLFRQLWTELGGSIVGNVRAGTVPPDAQLLATATSPALAEVIHDINKYSNNVMARQLFLTLGAVRSGPPGSTANAAQAVQEWLVSKGMRFPELVIDNGSGLSRTGRISPHHLGNLLLAAFDSPVFAELESSLPIASVDGTMKKRLGEQAVAGHAHIKTGSLEGVKAIAGYVFDRKGRRMVVVCLINDPDASAGQAVQDALLQWVYARP
jgi:D-alanyl-D-alanine carboxypeptidase/D-alanyl-D-alanine-endopeptidase (penicillin-binding protein 4)